MALPATTSDTQASSLPKLIPTHEGSPGAAAWKEHTVLLLPCREHSPCWGSGTLPKGGLRGALPAVTRSAHLSCPPWGCHLQIPHTGKGCGTQEPAARGYQGAPTAGRLLWGVQPRALKPAHPGVPIRGAHWPGDGSGSEAACIPKGAGSSPPWLGGCFGDTRLARGRLL